jgi:F-type H+-transporting ATPase subunit epsilon
MASDKNLRLVLVTPETTLLDKHVEYLKFPLFDGQMGVLPGRAPLVGRLGSGELQIREGGTNHSYFVDGGFVQVKGSVVSVLTNRAQLTSTLNAKTTEDELQAAQRLAAKTDDEFAAKFTQLQRARRKLALARKA